MIRFRVKKLWKFLRSLEWVWRATSRVCQCGDIHALDLLVRCERFKPIISVVRSRSRQISQKKTTQFNIHIMIRFYTTSAVANKSICSFSTRIPSYIHSTPAPLSSFSAWAPLINSGQGWCPMHRRWRELRLNKDLFDAVFVLVECLVKLVSVSNITQVPL